MKKTYSKSSRQGLPGGPNEMFEKVKGIIVSERGQWDFPGMNTLVPTDDGRITMRGVPYPVYGQDETGYGQMMYPGQEYQFPGNNVLELPMAQKGGALPRFQGVAKSQVPTYSDSLELYQNTVALENFLRSKKAYLPNYRFTQWKWKESHPRVGGSRVSNWYDLNSRLSNRDQALDYLNKLYDEDISDSQKSLPRNHYIKRKNNLIGSRDWAISGYDDKNLPVSYIHPQIKPQFEGDTSIPGEGMFYMYRYDPVAIKPGALLTPKELALRLKKYGKRGIPQSKIDEYYASKNPVTPIVTPPADIIDINKSNQQTPKKEFVRNISQSPVQLGPNQYEDRVRLITPLHEYMMNLDQYSKLLPTDSIPQQGNFLYRLNRKQLGGSLPRFQNTGQFNPQLARPNPLTGKYAWEQNIPKKTAVNVAPKMQPAARATTNVQKQNLNLDRDNRLLDANLIYSDASSNPLSNAVHTGLDAVGMVPVIGEPADLANALLYNYEGDLENTALSTAGMIPFLGMLGTGKRLLGKAGKGFKSKIDWGKWNPEIPNNKALMDEYLAIEQKAKADGTWMRNPDGTPSLMPDGSKPTPELWIQSQSKNWEKAYGKKGLDAINESYRGVGFSNSDPDFSKGFIEGDKAIFAADRNLANSYAWGPKIFEDMPVLTPNDPLGKSGVFHLMHPKGKIIDLNTLNSNWTNINLRGAASKSNIETSLNQLEDQLKIAKDLPKGVTRDNAIKHFKEKIDILKKNLEDFDKLETDPEALRELISEFPGRPATDEIAEWLPKTDINSIILRNINDGGLGNVTIFNNKFGKYAKSAVGNNGMFDMTNPNIYKALAPIMGLGVVGTYGANQLMNQQPESYQDGGDTYNMQRALELGYTPDEAGHYPSVDEETGMWLKSKQHPTAWMESMYGYQLNPEVYNNYNVTYNPEGYFCENQLQYVPKKFGGSLPKAQMLGEFNPQLFQPNPITGLYNWEKPRVKPKLSDFEPKQKAAPRSSTSVATKQDPVKAARQINSVAAEEYERNRQGVIRATNRPVSVFRPGAGNPEAIMEFIGVPGTVRFVKNPVQGLKGTGNTIVDLGMTIGPLANMNPTAALKYTTQGINPLTGEGSFRPQDVEGAFNTLDAAGLATIVGAGLKAPVQQGLRQTGKYLTTQTPLRNTYKLRSSILKENPEMFLYRARPVGQNPDMNMAAQLRAREAAGKPLTWWQKNLLNPQTNPQMLAREKYYGQWFEKDPSRLDFYIDPGRRNFADDDVIEILRTKLPKTEAAKLNVSQFDDAKVLSSSPETEFILPKNMVESAERFPESSWQQLIQEDKAFNTPHWWRGYGSKTPKQLPGSSNVYQDYFQKLNLKEYELQKLHSSGKIDYDTYRQGIKNYQQELLKNLGVGPRLGRGSYGEVFEFADDASKVVKLGEPYGGKWTPELIENLKSIRQNKNIAIPEEVIDIEVPSLYKNYNPAKKQAMIMPNLNKVSAQNLGLNKRDRYALFLKQARQLRDKGVRLDVENLSNFKFNKDKGVFDIYDINPGFIQDPIYYMQYIKDRTKSNLLDNMIYKLGGRVSATIGAGVYGVNQMQNAQPMQRFGGSLPTAGDPVLNFIQSQSSRFSKSKK